MSSSTIQNLTGKVALVTGGGSGIGATTALALAANGAAVAVTDLNGDSASAVAAEITGSGGHASGYALDVADEGAWRDVVARVGADLGPVTVLHGNAAPTGQSIMSRDLDVLTAEVEIWDLLTAVVLRGNMLACKHTIPSMIAAGGGSIVLTTSIKGRTGSSLRAAYSTTKGGLEQLVRIVATEYGRYGVRCNGVAPGIIITPGLREVVSEDFANELLASQLIGRFGTVEDIAAAVLYLASDASSFMTGQTLVIDGGMTVFAPSMSPVVEVERPNS
jgi:NAD(P)-dependent dehydrogenase (short-subunit alcohol dehydrogenase family)